MSKKNKKIAVYPGSFNPVHPGHLHVIRQAAQIFDKVIVLIADNPAKQYDIPAVERRNWINAMTTGYDWSNKVVIADTHESLVDYCKHNNIDFIVRGIRNGTDLDFERSQCEYNTVLSDKPANINYVYFTPPRHAEHLSSTSVKQFIKYATFEKLCNLYFLGGWGSFPDTVKKIFDAYKE